MSGLFSSIIQSNSSFLEESDEVSLCRMKSLSQKSIISWTERREENRGRTLISSLICLFHSCLIKPGCVMNKIDHLEPDVSSRLRLRVSLSLTIRSVGGDVLYWAHYDPAGPTSQTQQKYTFVHFSQTPGHTVLVGVLGGVGGGVFWYERQFSKSDNTNQHNGQQSCLAGGAHWNVDNQQLFTSRLPGQPHSFLLFCRVWSFYYYFKIPCNQFCQTWAGGLSRNKFPLRRAGCMTDPPTAPLCSLAGRGGERGRKYWILTVRENIAIKLNLLSSLINFKYRLDLTSTTSGRCLTPAVRSQYGGSGTLHRHAPLTTPDWTLGPEQDQSSL